MPEVRFCIRWPDGSEEDCYSPSTAIEDVLQPGQTYPLPDFLDRARTGLRAASARVEAKYGHPCSRARDQLARLEARAATFAETAPKTAAVTCLTLTR